MNRTKLTSMIIKGAGRLPGVSLLVALLAVVIYFIPGLSGILELNFAAVSRGEIWRLITGHLTHFSGEHIFWDVFAFLSIGILCEYRDSKRFAQFLIVSTLAISLSIWIIRPEVVAYRGLSGIDAGLYAWLCFDILRESIAERRLVMIGAAVLFLLGGFLKVIGEYLMGGFFFVAPDPTVTPLPLAHLVGMSVAGLEVVWHTRAGAAVIQNT